MTHTAAWQTIRSLWPKWEPNDAEAGQWLAALKHYDHDVIERAANHLYKTMDRRPTLLQFLAAIREDRRGEHYYEGGGLEPQASVPKWAKLWFPGGSRQPQDERRSRITAALEAGEELTAARKEQLSKDWGWT